MTHKQVEGIHIVKRESELDIVKIFNQLWADGYQIVVSTGIKTPSVSVWLNLDHNTTETAIHASGKTLSQAFTKVLIAMGGYNELL